MMRFGSSLLLLGVVAALSAQQPAAITIDYPAEGSIFPPDMIAPTFLWRDPDPGASIWRIDVDFGDGSAGIRVNSPGEKMRIGEIDPRCVSPTNEPPKLTAQQAAAHTWTPDAETWAAIKQRSSGRAATVTIAGAVSRGQVMIQVSKDPVGAPIFYRDVPLMPSEVAKGVIKPLAPTAVPLIAWRLRNVSEPRSRVLMEGLHTCANCHSFSRDGKTLGIDVDGPQNDKGLYALVSIRPQMAIRNQDTIAWSSFSGKLGSQVREGFMSQVSPDGQYVVTTIKPPGTEAQQFYYVANFTDYRFLQVFYPTRGILVWYNRATGEVKPLPGADDPHYVQSNAVWSPDGKYLVFSKAVAKAAYPEGAKLAEYSNDPNETPIQYDLYRIPFNGGKGGRPEPIAGASRNGMSNSFPKISPDGRWLVFVQARNGQLMRPDGKLYIVPVEGGQARRMRCNTPLMNSWHSFSPNGRWMVFSSKSRSPYTQMFLTHIDENGQDSPAILIENSTAANRAVNIPEFVNIPPDGMMKIDTPATEFYRLFDVAKELADKGQFDAAIAAFNTALELSPDDVRGNTNLGNALTQKGRLDEAIVHYQKALEGNPKYLEARTNLGAALAQKDRLDEAIAHYQKALEVDPKYPEAQADLGVALFRKGNVDEAIAHFETALEVSPKFAEAHTNLGVALIRKGKLDEAIAHFEKALTVNPDSLDAQINLGIALLQEGKLDAAIPHLEKALLLNPDSVELHVNLGAALVQKGRFDEAIPHFEKVLALAPDSAEARFYLGNAFYLKGRIAEALAHWRKVLAAEPNDLRVLNQAAWVLATNSEASFRNGAEAVELAERAVRVSSGRQPRIIATLAASYAEAGQFPKAIETARQALDLATQENNRQLAEGLNAMIALYQANTPFREKR
jgi:tetratricopeptide (TPR) repeat protein